MFCSLSEREQGRRIPDFYAKKTNKQTKTKNIKLNNQTAKQKIENQLGFSRTRAD